MRIAMSVVVLTIAGCADAVPSSAKVVQDHARIALERLAKGDVDGGEYHAELALKEATTPAAKAEAHERLASVAMHRLNYESAARHLTAAIESADAKGPLYLRRAECKLRIAKGHPVGGKWNTLTAAQRDVEEAVNLDPSLKDKAAGIQKQINEGLPEYLRH